jgi:septal ring factor EnvC (AmiA/AmiB activator)
MRFLRTLVPIALALALCCPAIAQSLSSSRDRKARLERDIKILEQQLSQTRAKEDNAAGQLDLLKAQTATRRELLQESELELRVLSDSVRTCRRRIEETQARIDTMSARYSTLVRNAYKNRDSRLWYMYILASDNVVQGLRRYGYLRRLSGELNYQGRAIKEERDTLEAVKMRLEELQASTRRLRDERAADLDKLKKEEDRSKALVAQLQTDRKKYMQQLSNKRKEVEALNKEIERLIAAEMDKGGSKTKGKTGGKKTDTKIDAALSGKFSANQGKLPWPAEGRVVSHFGRSTHPVYTKVEMPFNNGVGLAVDPDTPVKAVFDGVVKQIVVIPGYNQCILVQHGEYFTFYCKMGSVAVKTGDKVKTGQVIGHVATIAGETQLHFQLWQGKSPQDPEKWLKK